MTRLRPPAVAGMFYPDDPVELRGMVEGYLAEAAARRQGAAARCRAIVAPHAGYIYSGAVAGSAFDALSDGDVERVVILGPSHFVPTRGLVLPAADALVTPLGAVAVDTDGVRLVSALPQVAESEAVHAREHSLEVELPFVQVRFPRARVVPLAVGVASAEQVAEVIEALLALDAARLVISSDLSHYLPYESAVATDAETARAIARLEPSLSSVQACGVYPLNGLLLAASRLGWKPRALDLRNSGDTAGDRRRVVGYGAFAFEETGG
jgi:AmmeMemoRadiSam system protein B